MPCIVISPYSRGGRVDSTVYDHTSQLRLIETRFGAPVPNLTPWRRGITGDMTNAFDFNSFDDSRPNLGTPVLTALPKLPQCVPNVALGTAGIGIPYPVPFPQTMPVQETGPPTQATGPGAQQTIPPTPQQAPPAPMRQARPPIPQMAPPAQQTSPPARIQNPLLLP